jgi:Mg-chelatase subunit ChlD
VTYNNYRIGRPPRRDYGNARGGYGPNGGGNGGNHQGGHHNHGAYRVYLIDVSGSMSEPLDGTTKIAATKEAAKASLAHMATHFPYQRVGMVVFSDQAHLVFPFHAANDFRLYDFIDKIRPEGRTNLAAGLEMAIPLLARTPKGVRRQLTVLSDGGANERWDDLQPLLAKAVQHRISIWAISLVGRGSQTHDEPLLRWLADNTHGGRFLKVSDMQGLMNAFTGMRGRR